MRRARVRVSHWFPFGPLPSEDGAGTFFETLDEFKALLASVPSDDSHVLSGLLPSGRYFETRARELLEPLAAILGLEGSALNGSIASLDTVDHAIEALGAERFLTASWFEPLVAYVGEVVRATTGGKWRVVDEQGIWEPRVVTAVQQYYVTLAVYEALDDWRTTGGIGPMIRGEIGAAKLL